MVGRRTGESSLGVVEDGDLGRVFGEKGVITMKSMIKTYDKIDFDKYAQLKNNEDLIIAA